MCDCTYSKSPSLLRPPRLLIQSQRKHGHSEKDLLFLTSVCWATHICVRFSRPTLIVCIRADDKNTDKFEINTHSFRGNILDTQNSSRKFHIYVFLKAVG